MPCHAMIFQQHVDIISSLLVVSECVCQCVCLSVCLSVYLPHWLSHAPSVCLPHWLSHASLSAALVYPCVVRRIGLSMRSLPASGIASHELSLPLYAVETSQLDKVCLSFCLRAVDVIRRKVVEAIRPRQPALSWIPWRQSG